MVRKLDIETVKSKAVEWGTSVIEISHTKIDGKDMISFAKFYKDSSGQRKFPKSFAVPFGLRDQLVEAINAVSE
ncbi:hypothetical protein HY991_04190 [Candidatus Micrarchaeota archaeon]|nr:hypothetical protein [Candidatus Micrarchaeota archaeon]